jgi:hypothetical protein
MEMEQMMECLLAKIDTRMDANTKAMQEKVDADREDCKKRNKSWPRTPEGRSECPDGFTRLLDRGQ